jgi:hypothetical protein
MGRFWIFQRAPAGTSSFGARLCLRFKQFNLNLPIERMAGLADNQSG